MGLIKPPDAVLEMFIRTIPCAPLNLIIEAAEKFRLIITNERRRAVQECIAKLERSKLPEAAEKLKGMVE